MTLRTQIIGSPERLSDLVRAAEQRFREAEELLRLGRFSGAVYLFGLSGEMWLKAAVFRYLGSTPSSVISALFGPVRAFMRLSAPVVDPEAFHSVKFWAEYLIRIRRVRGQILSTTLAGGLRHHASRRFYEDWRIDLRYREISISQHHAIRVYNDVAWLRRNWDHLWR